MKRIAAFCFNLLFSTLLFAQYSIAIHYTVNNGLPSSTTYCVGQDKLGFIWIGTDAGLVRYDGTNFKVFTNLDGLPDNEILGLHYDSLTDRMWIIPYCRQACYYRQGTFYNFKKDSSLKDIKCDFGEFINGNNQKNVGEFLYNHSSIYECAKDSVRKISISRFPILQVKKWNDSIYDISTDPWLMQYCKGELRTLKPFHKLAFDQVEKCKWLDSLLIRYFPGSIEIYSKTYSGDYLLKHLIKLDKDKNLADITLSGDRFLISIWNFGLFTIDTAFKSPLRRVWEGNLNGFYEDKAGNLWITTTDNGIYFLRKNNTASYSSANGLEHDNITSLAHEKGGPLYFGNTYGEVFEIINGGLSQIGLHYEKPLERIRNIQPIANGLFLISNNSIIRYDLKKKISTLITDNSGGPKAILKLSNQKTILVGLIASIVNYDIESNSYFEKSIYKRIIALAQHPDGRIFCGSLDGLYELRDSVLISISNNDPRLQSRITSLCFSPDSILWIGTPSDGVIAYRGSKVIGQINTVNNLSYRGAICRKVAVGRPGEIWVATNAGIDQIKYHLQDSLVIDNVSPLNMLDGLPSEDVNDILVQDSMLYVATAHGLSGLNVNQISSPRRVPVYIMSVQINDKDSTVHNGTYSLLHNQNNLRIQYIGVSLLSGGSMRYQYRIKGSSDKWETTASTSVELRSMSPGKYTFEVAVLDKFGNRGKDVAQVNFIISPAFYQTIWFWSCIFLFSLGLGFYTIRRGFNIRQGRYEHEQKLNNKIVELEQQALKAQMNPHFIFNCLTAIQHFVNKEDIYSANMYLSNFAKLIRKTLDLSGEQYITLDQEVAYLESYIGLEKMRFQDKFRFSVRIAEDMDAFSVVVPPMLLQPIIENAIRHGLRYRNGDEGLLTVTFAQEGNVVMCVIDDNGIGIKRSEELKSNIHVEYQSKGMKLTESRIAAINMISTKKIEMSVQSKYENDVATGTTVRIKFEQ